MTATSVKTEDAEAIKDYLMSGGPFSDIMVPQMYIKKLFDADSLLMFDIALETELAKGAPHKVKILMDTLRKMVLNQIPRKARLTK